MKYHDSLGGKGTVYITILKYLICVTFVFGAAHTTTQQLITVRNYLENESKKRRGTPFDWNDWTFSTPADIPHQENGHDCGVILLRVRILYLLDISIGYSSQFI